MVNPELKMSMHFNGSMEASAFGATKLYIGLRKSPIKSVISFVFVIEGLGIKFRTLALTELHPLALLSQSCAKLPGEI